MNYYLSMNRCCLLLRALYTNHFARRPSLYTNLFSTHQSCVVLNLPLFHNLLNILAKHCVITMAIISFSEELFELNGLLLFESV